MSEDLDLFGRPVRYVSREQGRPEHVPSKKNINKIMILLAEGRPNKIIAAAIGVSIPTLKKHYLHLLKDRDTTKLSLKAEIFSELLTLGFEQGNVSALNTALKTLDRIDIDGAGDRFRSRAGKEAKKSERIGKKAAALVRANNPDMASPLGQLMAKRSSGTEKLN